MNKFIKDALDSVKWVDMPQYDDNTTHLVIPRAGSGLVVQVGTCCIIELAPYITNPPPDYTLASNWNNGVVPISKYLKVCITYQMGKMTKVDGNGYDYETKTNLPDTYMNLWLPNRGYKIIEII